MRMGSGPDVLLLLCITVALGGAQMIQSIGGVYTGNLEVRLLRRAGEMTVTTGNTTTLQKVSPFTVCVEDPVLVPVELFIDAVGSNMYYYNQKVEVNRSGEALEIPEVKGGAKISSWDSPEFMVQSFLSQESLGCMSLTSGSSSGTPTIKLGLTNGIDARYETCELGAANKVARCKTADPAEFTNAATLPRLVDGDPLIEEIMTKHGWIHNKKDVNFCSENQDPFNFFKPAACKIEEEEEPFPIWIIIVAIAAGVLCSCGICIYITKVCINKFGRSRSLWCIVCIFCYRCCNQDAAQKDEEEEDQKDKEVLVPMDGSNVINVRPKDYKPKWAQRYGAEAEAWKRYTA